MSDSVTTACYYFPNYHIDARNEARHGPGWSEWELVKRAEPRFPGHHQPNVPLWGYEFEDDPAVMAKKIDAAADHGIDAFIFDWYHYTDGPFLQRGVEEGMFNAPNRDRIQFGLMWANHDWVDIHPAKRNVQPDLQFPGAVTPEAYDRITSRVVAGYFNQSNYWLIDGKPYFSFYDLSALIKSFGSLEATREALDAFRAKTRDAGFPGLHINAVVWGRTILPREESISGAQELIDRLGFDSVTSYVWIHHVPLNEFPQTPFAHVMDKYFEYAREAENTHAVPYYPNVTMGWDASPRTVQSDMYDPLGYPFMASIGENTPQAFGRAVERVLEFLQGRPAAQRIFNINCWNEWTEGSYLEPDKRNGFGYLEALRDALAAVRQTS